MSGKISGLKKSALKTTNAIKKILKQAQGIFSLPIGTFECAWGTLTYLEIFMDMSYLYGILHLNKDRTNAQEKSLSKQTMGIKYELYGQRFVASTLT